MRNSEKIEIRINELVKNGNTKLILYPFGEHGKLAKSILNSYYGIDEIAIVDNMLSQKYSTIIKMEELKKMDIEDTKILFTSDRSDIREALLRKIHEVVPEMEVVELFTDYKEVNNYKEMSISRRNLVLDKIDDSGLIQNGMCYSPPNINATFFLPYVYMDLIQQSIFLQGNYYDRRMLDFVFYTYENGKIADYIRKNADGIVLDIGANIGNHSLYFTKEVGARKVIAFEPIRETCWILERNIEINNLTDKVELHRVGLSDKKGQANIINDYDYNNSGGNCLEIRENSDISLVALDDFGFKNVLFIKIDVEGMETLVLRGATETIKRSKPYIWVESFQDRFQETNRILAEMGYYKYVHLEFGDYLYYYEK